MKWRHPHHISRVHIDAARDWGSQTKLIASRGRCPDLLHHRAWRVVIIGGIGVGVGCVLFLLRVAHLLEVLAGTEGFVRCLPIGYLTLFGVILDRMAPGTSPSSGLA
jgi:hypothetical protein